VGSNEPPRLRPATAWTRAANPSGRVATQSKCHEPGSGFAPRPIYFIRSGRSGWERVAACSATTASVERFASLSSQGGNVRKKWICSVGQIISNEFGNRPAISWSISHDGVRSASKRKGRLESSVRPAGELLPSLWQLERATGIMDDRVRSPERARPTAIVCIHHKSANEAP